MAGSSVGTVAVENLDLAIMVEGDVGPRLRRPHREHVAAALAPRQVTGDPRQLWCHSRKGGVTAHRRPSRNHRTTAASELPLRVTSLQ